MADLAITAANVRHGAGYEAGRIAAGVALTAGQVIKKDTAGLAQLADANGVGEAVDAAIEGVVLHPCEAGQLVSYQKAKGLITIGATVAKGTIYCLSKTPGGIQPVADYGAAQFMTIVGIGYSATELDLQYMKATGLKSA